MCTLILKYTYCVCKLKRREAMDEKRSICRCSNTPEAAEFSSRDQTHVHCPCPKCENRAVYPMVAWRHLRKRALSVDGDHSDDGINNEEDSLHDEELQELPVSAGAVNPQFTSFSFTDNHAENQSLGLLMAINDDIYMGEDEHDSEREQQGISASSSDDDDNYDQSEGHIIDGLDDFRDRPDDVQNFVRDAVLRLMEIKGEAGFSIGKFEDLLKWGRELFCVNNEESRCYWPSSWADVQALLGDIGFKTPALYYICLDTSHPCLYGLMKSKEALCPHCEKPGTIPFYYLSVIDKVKRWFLSEDMCKNMTTHWKEREHWLPPERQENWGWYLKKQFWDGKQFARLSYFWDPDKEWTLPIKCPVHGCKNIISAEQILESPHTVLDFGCCNTRDVECQECFNIFQHTPQQIKGDPRNLAYDGKYKYAIISQFN